MHEYLRYDPVDGAVYWRVTRGPKAAGSRAGKVRKDGYRSIGINKTEYLEHRLIWWLCFGKWPENQIDHINGVRTDNRLCNLREATHGQNQANAVGWARSGCKGVYETPQGRYVSKIRKNNVLVHLGTFSTKDEAADAYRRAARKFHGEYANE